MRDAELEFDNGGSWWRRLQVPSHAKGGGGGGSATATERSTISVAPDFYPSGPLGHGYFVLSTYSAFHDVHAWFHV